MKIYKLKILSLFLFLFSCAYASVPVEGNFFTQTLCPAYLSKNTKSNPGKVFIEPGSTYSLVEINRTANPDWYRIDMDTETAPLRWVHQSCGEARYESSTSKDCNYAPGYADSHVLALSWQPGFCETYGYEAGKPECYRLSESSFSQQHLTLHGLWPNQKACGFHYQFCNGAQEYRHPCDYSSLNFSPIVADALSLYMPSFASGSCLERHEWNKHGTCQLRDVDAYFSLAIKLAREIDASEFANVIRTYHGTSVALSALENALERSFGPASTNKIYLGCNQGKLVDVYVYLPAVLSAEKSLSDLLQNVSTMRYKKGCPSVVKISDFYSASVPRQF